MSKLLVFDIWGRYAHFKKIYATTSALSYIIPSKTAIYGYVGAVIGLEKAGNQYLNFFKPGSCKVGIEVCHPIVMQRISTNLHPHEKGIIKANQNRKPTTIEYVYHPKYRIHFTHQDTDIYEQLKINLKEHKSVYTPTLGLANLLSDFYFVGEFEAQSNEEDNDQSVAVNSVIPRNEFVNFDLDMKIGNEIVEYSQFPVEMNTRREVTERTDVFIDRMGKPIRAFTKNFQTYKYDSETRNIILF